MTNLMTEMIEEDLPKKKPIHSFMARLYAAVLSGATFWGFYAWLLQAAPIDPLFWDGAAKFGYTWLLSFFCSVGWHLVFSAFSSYDYQISNWFEITFQTVKASMHTLFVIAGTYNWLKGLLPTMVSMDLYPWWPLLLAFIFIQVVSFLVAYVAAIWVATKMDKAGSSLGEKTTKFSHRAAWGKDRSKERRPRERGSAPKGGKK
jgi:hypothetical protein